MIELHIQLKKEKKKHSSMDITYFLLAAPVDIMYTFSLVGLIATFDN